MEKIDNKTNQRNLGIDFLRVWMCFGVVLIHFWMPESTNSEAVRYFIHQTQQLAVPVFMLISFVVLSKEDTGFLMSKEKLENRLRRLIIPITIWAIVYAVIYLLAQTLLHKDYNINIGTFLSQLFLGHEYNKPMWFQNTLVYFTVSFYVIYKVEERWRGTCIFCLSFLAVLSFVLQYTGMNHQMLDSLEDNIKIPLGRFINMLPYACIGILLVQTRVLNFLRSHPISVLVLTILFILIIVLIPEWGADTFGSNGLRLIIMSISFVAIFYVLPFEKIPSGCYKLISFFSKYTLGIYCIHNMIGGFYNQVLVSRFGFPYYSLLECLIVFTVSLVISVLIYHIPNKYCKSIVS